VRLLFFWKVKLCLEFCFELLFMKKKGQIKGRIHSFESFGTVDGPGIRFVVFMGGCPLRCQYCHNIDMVFGSGWKEYSVDEVVEKIVKNKAYFDSSGGGVTFSGGEPLMQSVFLRECLRRCKEAGIHTTVDTSLFCSEKTMSELISYVDLWMVSLKHFDDEKHKLLTGVSNVSILRNLRFLSEKGVRLWLRFVLLPSITDTEINIRELISFCDESEFEKIEILPYHKMGIEKWERLGIKYELSDIDLPSQEDVLKLKERLDGNGFEVVVAAG